MEMLRRLQLPNRKYDLLRSSQKCNTFLYIEKSCYKRFSRRMDERHPEEKSCGLIVASSPKLAQKVEISKQRHIDYVN